MSAELLERIKLMAEVCREGWGFGPAKSEIADLLDDASSRIIYLQSEVAVLMEKLGLLLPTYEGVQVDKIEWVSYDHSSSPSSLREGEESGIEPLHRDGNIIQFVPRRIGDGKKGDAS